MSKVKLLQNEVESLRRSLRSIEDIATALKGEADLQISKNEKLIADNYKLHSTLQEAYNGILNITHTSLYTTIKDQIKRVLDETKNYRYDKEAATSNR